MSLNFKPSPAQKSSVVKFHSPNPGYAEVSSASLDKLWQNKKTGCSISYLSDCNNPTDPSLQNIFKGITSEIESVSVISSSFIEYNYREALRSIVEGRIDGVSTRFELVIFKKNSCTYILTYAATTNAFSNEKPIFNHFVEMFRVP
ncbi:MAG: hypothetical protein A2Z20_12805 [Bdellovibrionales bacterium RBG_16_40_8]|nr:MAG: hypothetical protein A2Z20_12805 [Bdellovibrionales bacterium RBG_16_40_8]